MSTPAITPNPYADFQQPAQGANPYAEFQAPAKTPAPQPTQPGNIFTSGHPLDTFKANINEAQQGKHPGDGLLMGALKNFGAGGADVIHSVGHTLLHPIDTISAAAHEQEAEHEKPLMEQAKDFATNGSLLGMGGRSLVSTAKGLIHNPARTAGQLGTGAIMGEVAAPVIGAAATGMEAAGTGIRSAAIGDTDAAALRGLRVPPAGKKVLPMQSSVQNARPFLSGADSMEDLQGRIKPAKDEIYAPVQQAIDASGNTPIKGPDGPTTLRDLEAERKQLSAMNRGLKTGDPAALQLAQQKGLSQAEALAREEAIKAHLDPELAKYGLDPQEIRKAYGSVAQVGNQVAGRSTLLEKPQSYGFGKLVNPMEVTKGLEVTKPGTYLKPISNLFDAGRDIAAGRYWNGSPSDVGIREGFANGGPKPDLGKFSVPQPPAPRGLLGNGAIGTPGGPNYSQGGFPQRPSLITPARPAPKLLEGNASPTSNTQGMPVGNLHPETPNLSTARTRVEPTQFAKPQTVPPRTLIAAPDGTVRPAPIGLPAPKQAPQLESTTGRGAPSQRSSLLAGFRNEAEAAAAKKQAEIEASRRLIAQ